MESTSRVESIHRSKSVLLLDNNIVIYYISFGLYDFALLAHHWHNPGSGSTDALILKLHKTRNS